MSALLTLSFSLMKRVITSSSNFFMTEVSFWSERQWTHTFSWCLLSVSIRTCLFNKEVKMSSCWVYSTIHWPVSLWVKTWLESSLHMISLHTHCLKKYNFRSSLHMVSLHKYCLKKRDIRSSLCMISLHKHCLKNVTSEAHYAWSASINTPSKTRLRKLITQSQPPYILPQKHDLRSSLHIVSLYLIDQTHWVYKYDFRSSLHMAFTSYIRLTKFNKLCASKHQ